MHEIILPEGSHDVARSISKSPSECPEKIASTGMSSGVDGDVIDSGARTRGWEDIPDDKE